MQAIEPLIPVGSRANAMIHLGTIKGTLCGQVEPSMLFAEPYARAAGPSLFCPRCWPDGKPCGADMRAMWDAYRYALEAGEA